MLHAGLDFLVFLIRAASYLARSQYHRPPLIRWVAYV
nr:MAG TPA: hypothetical protein [Caudoviricetes sp.]